MSICVYFFPYRFWWEMWYLLLRLAHMTLYVWVLPGNVSWRALCEWTASRRCRSWRSERPSGWSGVSLVFVGAWQCSYSGDISAYLWRFQMLRLKETTRTQSDSQQFCRCKQFDSSCVKPADELHPFSSCWRFCNMGFVKSGFKTVCAQVYISLLMEKTKQESVSVAMETAYWSHNHISLMQFQPW